MAAAPEAPTSVTQKDAFYIPSLDGMRAVAFFIVFLAHAKLWTRFPGNFGVTLFFFLSGFLITTLLRMEYDRTERISLKNFYLRRVLRIFPPFYLILLVTVALSILGLLVGDVGRLPITAQMLHLSNYQIIMNGYEGYPLGTYPYWSLAVEEHFYLVFPVLYIVLRRYLPVAKHQAAVLLTLCGIVLIWRCVLVLGFHVSQDRTYIATDTRVDSILFGCILAIYGNPLLDTPLISGRWLKFLVVPLSILVLLVTFFIPGQVLRETVRYTIQGVALYPVFIAAILYPGWSFFKLLNLSWVKILGGLSYSLYLLHEVVIYNVYPLIDASALVQATIALGVSVMLATAIYRVVERPCAQLRKRLSYRSRGVVTQAEPTARAAARPSRSSRLAQSGVVEP